MDQQPVKKFNIKKALIIAFITLIFACGAVAIGVLVHQNNNQKTEIDKLKKGVEAVEKKSEVSAELGDNLKSATEKPTEKKTETKEYITGVNGEYKIDVPADWKVESRSRGHDWNMERYAASHELTITTTNNRKIVLDAAVNPPVGGAGGDDRPITVEKLADTKIDEYKVLQLTSDNGEQEIVVMAAKGGYGRLANGAWYRSFNKSIRFQDNGNNHLIQFYVNGDTRNFSEQEKAEIAKAMSSFARR